MAGRTIGRLAEAAGVHVETIRYYERRGLLARPSATGSGYRQYDDDHVWRLGFIRRAKSLGFTLDEIASLLETDEYGGRSAERVLATAASRLVAVDRQLADLGVVRARLRSVLALCEGGDADCVTLDSPVLRDVPDTGVERPCCRCGGHPAHGGA